ncbi:unnamed protein product [Onchocerca flexuosa]|nr:unnamed protein product [Onchocerca flexuosa]
MTVFNGCRKQLSINYKQQQQKQQHPEINFHVNKPFTITYPNLNIILWMIFSAMILTTNGTTCSYKTPNVDEIVFDVPLDIDYAENDMEEDDGRLRKIRNVNDDIFQPLRIHLHYDKTSIDK